MSPKQKKILIITIPTAIILIILIVLAIMYFSTDFLKSDKKLFLKYMSQDIDAAKIVMDNTSEKAYKNLLNENKYEGNAELTAKYTKNINTSQEDTSSGLNKLKLTIDSQSDFMSNYNYKDIKLTYDNESLLRAEYIQEENIYGLRFPELFNQFLSVKNKNLKEVAEKAGLTEEQIELIPDTIEEFDFSNKFSFTEEELAQLQTKYLKVLSDNISNDKYSRHKGAVITVDGNSITTNAYSLSLTQEQANDVYIKILEELKNDEIILNKIKEIGPIALSLSANQVTAEDGQKEDVLVQNFKENIDDLITEIQNNNIGTNEIKYTVYESNRKTVRTVISAETEEVTIDLNWTDDGIDINIQDEIQSETDENTKSIQIAKHRGTSEDEFSIKTESVLGNIVSTAQVYRNKTTSENNATTKTGITYDDGADNLLEIEYSEDIDFVQEIEPKAKLDGTNNVVLNDYEAERVYSWVSQLSERLQQSLQERMQMIENIEETGILSSVTGQTGESVQIEQTEGLTEVEKNRFNSRFEFYTGEEISSEQVVSLIEEAKDSLKGVEVSYSEASSNNKKVQSLRLQVEKDAGDLGYADTIKGYIEKNKNYTVVIQYDNSTGVVNSMTITVNQ